MPCHLMEQAEPADVDSALKFVEKLVDSDHFGISFFACTRCGQTYVRCFHETHWTTDPDEPIWVYWVPIDPSEVEGTRRRPQAAVDLIQTSRHITKAPGGRVYWSESPEAPLGLTLVWNRDEAGEKLRIAALTREVPLYIGLVPLSRCIPADPEYRGDRVRKTISGEGRREMEWHDRNVPYLIVYPRGDWFVVFSDYHIYYGLLERKPEFVPCAILGQVESDLVRDLRGPLDEKDLGLLLRFGWPTSQDEYDAMPIRELIESPLIRSDRAATVAEAALLRAAAEYQVALPHRSESALIPRQLDEHSFACILLCEEHADQLGELPLRALLECRDAAVERGDTEWLDVLPWDLAAEALGITMDDPARGLSCLVHNLSHHNSGIRTFMTELGWLVHRRLPREVAAEYLLKNTADTIVWWTSFGLCRRLFENDDELWRFADAYRPPESFEKQYRDRLTWAREEGGKYTTQWELLDMEAKVRALIGRYALRLRSARG